MNQVNVLKANTTAMAVATAVVLFSLFAASNAFAAFSAINENTGFSSLNLVTADGDDIFTLVNSNEGDVVNLQDVLTETGLNTSDSNTGDGMTDSGNISVLGGFANEFNLNASSYTNNWWSQAVGSSNDTTGAESENDASATFTNDVTAVQTNDADLDNDIGVDASTGENSADTNTGSGDVETGNAEASTSQENTANGNSFTSSGSMMSALFSNWARNITTGFSSTNTSDSSIDNEMDVVSTNTALFSNVSDILLNTGDNTADSNTGSGGADTGNAEGMAVIINDANANAVMVEIEGADTNSLTAVNDTTGAESDNDTTTSVTGDIDIISTNDADFDNDAVVDVNTGANSSDTNTGSGMVETGNGEGSILIDNGSIFNQNATSLSFNSATFDLMAGNMTTGFSSDNDATAEWMNTVDIVNSNEADVANDASIDITTGDNTSDSNTGSGMVDTGNAGAATSITNDLNVNTTLVNWMAMGAMVAGNDTTGATSTNDASVAVDNVLTIVNSNTGTITNTSSTTSSTGGNSSSFNTGSGNTETGNSSVQFGIINQGNGNFNVVQ